MTHVAIVIVHYNGDRETRECLASLKQLRNPDLQVSVIVVDNGSKEVFNAPETIQPANTVILRSDTNLGFTSGNNLGIRHALEHFEPDYLLLLNNDTTVAPNFLEELVECAVKNDNAGMIAPVIYFSKGREFHKQSYHTDEKGNVIWFAGGSIDWPNFDAFHRGVDELDRDQFMISPSYESEFATGCTVLIPKRVIDTVGMFDTRYFLYLEDVDLSIRVKKAGYKILLCPSAKVWHQNAGSSGGAGSALHQYYQTRNRLYFFMKFAGEFKINIVLPQFIVKIKDNGQVMKPMTTIPPRWKRRARIARVRVSVISFAIRMILSGTSMERRATFDWFFGKMGKQAIL